MQEISTFRLTLLRAMYLLIAVGLGLTIWPAIIAPPTLVANAGSVVRALLGSLALVALLGLRYPLQMLPVLLWEALWKTLWLLLVPLPQWLQGGLDPATAQYVFEISFVVLVYLAIPWRYVHAHYILKPGTPWRQLSQPCETSD